MRTGSIRFGLAGKPSIIVKFYRPERWTTQQILEEHSYTQELVDLEIPGRASD